jgi:dTDP-4-amino-4,6-dideoxygalactose transaminase
VTIAIEVPFVDLRAQYATIRDETRTAINGVLDASWFILGHHVASFEEKFSAYCGGGEAIGVGSGTEALHLALLACGVGPGDEVITVANTFIATALAIDYAGGTSIFVDVDPVTYNIDVTQVEARITSRTKAILPIHLFGQPADLDPILALAKAHGLYVVEDACQAHGAEYKGQRVGALGDIGCFSFYPAKNLGAYGDGGLVLTRNPALAEQLRLLRNYGQTRKYFHRIRGHNSRLDELQAAVLEAKLTHLDRWNDMRRRIAARYDAGIDVPHITLPGVREDVCHVYHLYVIRTPYRDALGEWLLARGIRTQVHYPVPIHRQEAYQHLGLPDGTLPVTERLCNEILSLPMYPELTDAQIEWVVESVNAFQPVER